MKNSNLTPQQKHRRAVRIGFVICTCIMLLASLLNWGLITGWGNVDIDRITISGNDGAEFSALLYRPANATDKTPAPGIMMYHGNAGNARNHESWAMEFARRGFVVLAPDLYGSGNSEAYFTGFLPDVDGPASMGAATSEVSLIYEADMFTRYFLTLPYVDTDNWLSSGHSMGGVPSFAMGARYNAKGILVAAGTSAWNFANNTLDKCPEIYVPYLTAWKDYTRDTVIMMGDVEHSKTLDPAQMDKSIQTKCLPTLQKYPGHEADESLVPNQVYGSFEEGNGYVCLVEPNRIHEAAFVSRTTIGNLLKYGQLTIGDKVPNFIDSEDQIWMYKDYLGMFGTLSFAAFLCALALLLIEEVPAFSVCKRPLGRNVGARGKGLAIMCVISLVMPYIVCKTDAFGIVGGANGLRLWNMGFHINYSNLGFGVIVGLTLVCTIGLVVTILLNKKSNPLRFDDFGMAPEGYEALDSASARRGGVVSMALHSLLLAAIVVAVGWAYMQWQSDVLGTDFYSWFFGVKPLPISKLGAYWPYLIVFMVCFVPLSIDMNIIRRLPESGNETRDTIVAILVNVALATAAVILIVAGKWYLQSSGSAADANWFWKMGLDTQRIWGMPLGMAVAVGSSTFLYKKTGNTWLCAFLVGTIACLMGVLYGGTRFHYLTFFC